MVVRKDDGVSVIFAMSCITIVFILMSITFVAVRTRIKVGQEMDYYSSSITQQEIDEAWQKYQQRQQETTPLKKTKNRLKDSIDRRR